jgi:acrylyl-CoA reductase (NADPH)
MLYKAFVTEELSPNNYHSSFKELPLDELHKNDVLIRVKWSSLNYKDALIARGHKGITREYPHTPGVDAAGIVEESNTNEFSVGDKVLVTGHDLGMNTSGGYSEYISVPKDWVVKLEDSLSLRESMIYGTAGITAAICIDQLIKHNLKPNDSRILVTGATGGVGSMSVAILGKIGFEVIASTGKLHKSDFLKSIGATDVIHRNDVYDTTGKPLLKKRWEGAIDTVGGNTLSTVIRSTNHHGSICVVGLVESPELKLNVFPFLQRGVSVLGIDSAERGIEIKKELWGKLASDWKPDCLNEMVKEISLYDIQSEIDSILEGKQIGKTLINCEL